MTRHELLETAPARVGGARIAVANVDTRRFRHPDGHEELLDSALIFILEGQGDGEDPLLVRVGSVIALPRGSYEVVAIERPPRERATLVLEERTTSPLRPA